MYSHGTKSVFWMQPILFSLNQKLVYIVYDVHVLSQFLAYPHHCHLKISLKVIISRLMQAKVSCILALNSLTLQAFSDADWGGCKASRQSLLGYCVMLGSAVISWKSKKQHSLKVFCRGCEVVRED